MVIIAVAGGSGGWGQTIVEVLSHDNRYQVIILSRKAPKDETSVVPVVEVDYTDVDRLSGVLESQKIHTVISTLNSSFGVEAELNLIAAADRSPTTQRYVANIWGIMYTPEESKVFPAAEGKAQAIAALEATSLEYTSFLVGFLVDYFVMPHVKSYMTPLTTTIDFPHNFAAIPGTGDVPVVLTYSPDVALFVAEALALPKWDKLMYVIGDRVTMNELVKMAQEVKGVQFTVVHDSMDELKAGRVTELPSHPAVYPFFPKEVMQPLLAFFGVMFESGKVNLTPSATLNDQFPQIKVKKVRELLEETWKGA